MIREDKESRKLVYYCKNCQHIEEADNSSYCVYVSETTTYSSKDKTLVGIQTYCAHARAIYVHVK